MKNKFWAFLLSGIWISLSEFVRNELLFKSYWLDKYQSLGLEFPSSTLNNALWGLWSFIFALVIVILAQKLKFIKTVYVSWIMTFLMMWLVIGNLNVLPFKLMIFAIPLSIIEVIGAAYLSFKILKRF